ncbi:MAG: metallophosphoesterase, partial [Candidatus Lindowbacteria bacterium]|nr:metallophosphoesterase [Candidatus Lindowbacteria bacterium]
MRSHEGRNNRRDVQHSASARLSPCSPWLNRLLRVLVVFALCFSFGRIAIGETLDLSGIVFEDANSNGAHDAGEKLLFGVVVSDGKDIAATDERGAYRLRTETGTIVFVSVPGTHHAQNNKFYRDTGALTKGENKVNFPLVRNSDTADNGRFTFVFVTDTHSSPLRNAPEGIRKAYGQVAELNPAFVVHGGDVILDALKLNDEGKVAVQYDLYTNQLAPIIKKPFYHTLGNHDVFGWVGLPNPKPAPELYGKKGYEKYLGPTYYSFNYKHCHFVVLDSIGRTNDRAEGSTYYGFVDPAQLEWLRKDLSKVSTSTPIVIVTHIPTINALGSLYGLKSEVVTTPSGDPAPKHQVQNFAQLLGETLKGYNFKLALAGHYHTYEEIHWHDNQHDALFVVGGSICGEWWKGDRTVGAASWPEGFTVVKVNGQEFKPSYAPYG